MELNAQLNKYYSEIFPIEELFKTYQITETRELSFSTQQGAYIRYLSFPNPGAFREKVTSVVPAKIDIGPIFTGRPTKLGTSKPAYRELVFDIDLTDYPRECCKGKTICKECYQKIKCAIELLDYILRVEFGFKEIGFVFSGRRGLHCWVFDYVDLPSTTRLDIYKYFQVIVEKNLHVEEYNQIMEKYSRSKQTLISNWFIRIDKGVTTGLNHLCKIPFSVHAESLGVSVPIDPTDVPELEDLPKLSDILDDPSVMDYYVGIMKTWRNIS